MSVDNPPYKHYCVAMSKCLINHKKNSNQKYLIKCNKKNTWPLQADYDN
jgi:hypothetical protein